MNKQNELLKKALKEKIFLENTFEEIALKHEPGENEWNARAPGGPEWAVEQDSTLVMETINEAKEISEDDYENY